MKKLAIVGSGSKTRDNAPFDDPSFDIWVFNEAAQSTWCKRWTACFQMHEPEIYTGHNTKNANHWQWLQQEHGKPIYMQEIDHRVPDCTAFPLDDAIQLCGVKMFPTTFAYMAALAILQEYEVIRIYGVELSASEYQYQANGYLFWFGFLRGRLGTENVDSAVLHLDKNIFEVPLYGYEGNLTLGVDYFRERSVILENEWTASEKNLKNIHKAIARAIGDKEYEKIRMLVSDYQYGAILSGENAGALSEAQRYQTFGERYADRGGFELSAATAQMEGEKQKPMVWHYGGMIEYVWNIYKQTKGAQGMEQLSNFIDVMGKRAYDLGAQLGCYKENIAYINKYDDGLLANGISR